MLSYCEIDAPECSFAYIACWAEGKDVVKAALSNIRRTVQKIIHSVGSDKLREDIPSERVVA